MMMNMTGMNFNNTDMSGTHTAISGGRKPTADSYATSVYKQAGKMIGRTKFSNGGGSIGRNEGNID
jgi:hypothetical protein